MKLALLSLLRPPADGEDVAIARAVELAAQGKRLAFRIRFANREGRQVPMTIETVEAA